ncbi:mevalonate kinase family protein [Fibrivirga algicola]|uniref:GHMP kinase n=1 Tax=Fibrivirga algicola TaxID=2950420 RepID=A0ABX0QK81_9BACT|nr:galactokinase family protein [Fibrivirga algicola]NID12541.1 GHMP kinase [Fibrivirga algicola]
MTLTASTPGRICLFGEHQDYLGLPVLAAAISRRIDVTAHRMAGPPQVRLYLPDLKQEVSFSIAQFPLPYLHDRDYFSSALNVLHREGLRFSAGISGSVSGNIPINAGTSSSSALLISWLNVLSQLADEPRSFSAAQLAEMAYVAEVLEFGDPGGRMDHYATALGGVIYLESQPQIRIETFQTDPAEDRLGTFVLGDSGEPKDTIGLLKHVKYGMLAAMEKMRAVDASFSLETLPIDDLDRYAHLLTADEQTLVRGNLSDRDVLRQALSLLRQPTIDHRQFGQLLTIHQTNLREAKRISTPKIDRMIDAALAAGAYGAKINGSGGGGCMFAYAPGVDSSETPGQVAEAIERAGGRAYLINVDRGTQLSVG